MRKGGEGKRVRGGRGSRPLWWGRQHMIKLTGPDQYAQLPITPPNTMPQRLCTHRGCSAGCSRPPLTADAHTLQAVVPPPAPSPRPSPPPPRMHSLCKPRSRWTTSARQTISAGCRSSVRPRSNVANAGALLPTVSAPPCSCLPAVPTPPRSRLLVIPTQPSCRLPLEPHSFPCRASAAAARAAALKLAAAAG